MSYTKSKIKSIIPKGSWSGNYGLMHSFEVAFEDGVRGVANAKKEKPPYEVGAEVWYMVSSETAEHGKKLKVKVSDPERPQLFNSGGKSEDAETIRRIEGSWAMTTAMTYLGRPPSSDDELLDTARLMLILRDKVHSS